LTFRMETALPARLSKLRSRWQLLTAFLQRYDIRQSTRIRRETVRSHEQGLSSHLHLLLQVYRRRAQSLESTLMALNPMAVLERGYAICRNRLGNVVKDSGTMTPGELFTVTLARGRIEGEVKGIKWANLVEREMTKKIDFESALKRLEEIVKSLETGDLPLDKSLELFEEGVKLSRFCHARLDEADRKVEILVKKDDGRMEAVPFETEEKNGQGWFGWGAFPFKIEFKIY
jgi:exodeoxyribonuclease VII small subunit